MNCGTSCKRPARQHRITSTSTDKEAHRRDLLRHRAVYDEIGYAAPRRAGGSHAPLCVAVLELHDALDADVAPLRALFLEQVKRLVACAGQVDRERDDYPATGSSVSRHVSMTRAAGAT